MVWVSEYIVIFGFLCVCVCVSRVSVRLCMVGPATHEARVDLMIDTDTDTHIFIHMYIKIHTPQKTHRGLCTPSRRSPGRAGRPSPWPTPASCPCPCCRLICGCVIGGEVVWLVRGAVFVFLWLRLVVGQLVGGVMGFGTDRAVVGWYFLGDRVTIDHPRAQYIILYIIYTPTQTPTHSPSPSITIQRGTTTGSPISSSTAVSLEAPFSFLLLLLSSFLAAAAGSYLYIFIFWGGREWEVGWMDVDGC